MARKRTRCKKCRRGKATADGCSHCKASPSESTREAAERVARSCSHCDEDPGSWESAEDRGWWFVEWDDGSPTGDCGLVCTKRPCRAWAVNMRATPVDKD